MQALPGASLEGRGIICVIKWLIVFQGLLLVGAGTSNQRLFSLAFVIATGLLQLVGILLARRTALRAGGRWACGAGGLWFLKEDRT